MIYKYDLGIPCEQPLGEFSLRIPKMMIKNVLDIQLQGKNAVMWAEVEPTKHDTLYSVVVVWTGYSEPNDPNYKYLKTIQEPSTGLVYHYYGSNELNNFFDI